MINISTNAEILCNEDLELNFPINFFYNDLDEDIFQDVLLNDLDDEPDHSDENESNLSEWNDSLELNPLDLSLEDSLEDYGFSNDSDYNYSNYSLSDYSDVDTNDIQTDGENLQVQPPINESQCSDEVVQVQSQSSEVDTDDESQFSESDRNDFKTRYTDINKNLNLLIKFINLIVELCGKKLDKTLDLDFNRIDELKDLFEQIIDNYHNNARIWIDLALIGFPDSLNGNLKDILEALPIIKGAKLKDNNIQCSICCMEKEDIILMLPCNHFYHKSCIESWLKLNEKCLICKYNLKTN